MLGWFQLQFGSFMVRIRSLLRQLLDKFESVVMILRRPIEFFYCWLSLIAIFLSGCSSIEKNHRSLNRFYSARSVLKSWRKKAQEQSARLFDRLPQNPEVFYTPVNKITTPVFTTPVLILNIWFSNFSRKWSGAGATQSRFTTSQQMTGS
jgi:hypothetical protein